MNDRENKLSIGVDIGGTKTRVGLCSRKGEIKSKATKETGNPEEVIEHIKHIVSKTQKKKNEIQGIGIGSVGPLDLQEGLIINPTNLPSWNKVPIKEMVEDTLNMKTWLDNDANVAALAEREFGVQSDNLIYMTISTGIGGGIISEGKLIHGKGNAGEIGHMTLVPSGPLCNCGKRGCLEALASGTAISKRGKEKLGIEEPEKVFEKAREGEPLAQKIVENVSRYLGLGISNLAEIIDPEYIVLGGGVMKSWDQMRERIRSTVRSNARNEVHLTLTSLGSENGLLGASLLPFYHTT